MAVYKCFGMREPGIEPGSPRWQRDILTIKPLARVFVRRNKPFLRLSNVSI